MDEDGIGLVLAKTAELRSKIVSSIQRKYHVKDKENKECEESKQSESENQQDDDVDDEEEESLLNIKDALESLEVQLSSLQALQQQQWYERESALAEIEFSQKKLLKELKEYKGNKDLEVISEAIAFAGETKESNDLLLPPYPSRPHSTPSDNGYLSTFSYTHNKLARNGISNDHPNNHHEKENHERVVGSGGAFKKVKGLIDAAAKAAFTIVGVITILSLAGFEPRLKKQDKEFKISDLLNFRESNENRGITNECPQGKVLVIENGETRCVVKERVEVPFESVVATPDVSLGCG